MPRCASSNLPILRPIAPVNDAALVAEQLALQDVGGDGAAVDRQEPLVAARAGAVQRVATSSLPVPLSPTISTFERVGATSRICSNSDSIGGERPMIDSKP